MITTEQDASPAVHDVRRSRRAPAFALGLVTLIAVFAVVAHAATFWSFMSLPESDLWILREGARLFWDDESVYSVRFAPGYWTLPPFAAAAGAPLLAVPVDSLFPLWTALNAALLLVILVISFRPALDRVGSSVGRAGALIGLLLCSIALTPVSETLGLGQVGVALLALCLIDVAVLSPRGSRLAGGLVGLAAAFKLTPALFIVYFAITRQWRAAGVAAATGATAWLLTALLAPSDMSRYLLGGTIIRTNEQIDGFGSTVWNQSLLGLLDGLPSPWLVPLWLLASAAVVGIALWTARLAHATGQHVASVGLIGVASVLVTPIAWHHHATWVIPALGALVGDGRRRSSIYAASVLAVLLMVSPRETLLAPDRFVVLYVVLLGLLIHRVAAATPPGLSSSPHEYYADAYQAVMYTGLVGRYSTWMHRRMEQPFRDHPSGHVLEVGAGSGQHAPFVSGFSTYTETDICVDPSDTITRSEPGGLVTRRWMDAEDLSGIPDSSMDRVIATCLLAHLDHPARALAEWRRVTSPGGTISIYVPTEPGMLLRLVRRVIMVPKSRSLGQDHERTVYRDHRNHYPGMRALIADAFAEDHIQRRRYPIHVLGWNLALFEIVHVRKAV